MVLIVTPEDIARNDPDAYTLIKHLDTAGFTAVSGPHIRLNNLRVPAANLLAPPGEGATVIEHCFDASAALVGAISVGIMRATFSAALDFTKGDSRGGSVPILARQSVADIMIDIKMRTEASRYLTWKACHCLENGPGEYEDRRELVLEAKIFCSDNAVQCVVDAMKAVGMYVESPGVSLCPFRFSILGKGNLTVRRWTDVYKVVLRQRPAVYGIDERCYVSSDLRRGQHRYPATTAGEVVSQ